MDKLPDEIILEIISLLQHDPDPQAGQSGLSKLASLSKRYHTFATALLFGSPVLDNPKQVEKWAATYGSWTTPFTLCELKSGKRSLFKPEKLLFHFPFPPRRIDPSNGEELRYVLPKRLPDIEVCHSASICSKLASLEFVNCRPFTLLTSLLGPGQPLRRILSRLVVRHDPTDRSCGIGWLDIAFCLEALQFVDSELFTLVWEWDDGGDPEYDPNADDTWERHEPEEDRDPEVRPANLRELMRAHLCPSVFRDIYNHDDAPQMPPSESLPLIRSKSASSYPFSSLAFLELDLDAEEIPFFLVFTGGAFPYLKHFKPIGRLRFTDQGQFNEMTTTMRYSVTRSTSSTSALSPPATTAPHGVVIPPVKTPEIQTGLFSRSLETELLTTSFWSPLPPPDYVAFRYAPYRGPKLEVLDLSEVWFMLIGEI